MLRLPSPREIADLFFTPSSVDGAVAMLDRAKARLASVAANAERLSDMFRSRAAAAHLEAVQHETTADNHQEEAARAHRVADRLATLIA